MVAKKHPKSFPAYKVHKASKRAYVWLNGKRKYLGAAGSPESHEAYNRLIAELAKNNGRVVPSILASADNDLNKTILVAHLIVEFLTAHKAIFSQAEYNQFRYALPCRRLSADRSRKAGGVYINSGRCHRRR